MDRPGKQNTIVDLLSRTQNCNNDVLVEYNFPNQYIFVVSIESHWFGNIASYLATGNLPSYMSPQEKRKVIQTSASYSWTNEELYKTRPNLIIRRCVREDEVQEILKACDDEPCGGHFINKRNIYKFLLLGYYCHSIFKDAKECVKRFDSFQRMGKLVPSNEMPLQPQVIIEPFEKWILDFVGPMNPPSRQKMYFLVYINYVKKWVESKALSSAIENVVVSFLFEDIFTRFGVPREIVIDQSSQFTSKLV